MSVLNALSTAARVEVSADDTTTPQAAAAELLANIARLYRLASLGLTGNAPGLAAHQTSMALFNLSDRAFEIAYAFGEMESFDI